MKNQINKSKSIPLYAVMTIITCIVLVILYIYLNSNNETLKYKTANILMESGDYLGARKIYTMILEKKPVCFSAHYGLGMSWCAEAIFKTPLELVTFQDWYNAIYHMTVAYSLQKSDQVSQTLGILYFNLGTYFRNNNNQEAAIKQIEQAVIYNPKLLKALNLLGAIYHERGYYNKAEYYYKKALELKPDYAMAYFNLGALAWVNEDYKLAFNFFQKAVSLSPDNKYFQDWLEKALTQQSNK